MPAYEETLRGANNYVVGLIVLERFEEGKSLMREIIPVAQRVVGESNELMLNMRSLYADALHLDPAATLDDLREAVTTLEEIEPTARRVLGGAHPTTTLIDVSLRRSLVTLGAALRARDTPSLPENAADD